MFSFGSVLFEVLTWRLPWVGVPPLQASRVECGMPCSACLVERAWPTGGLAGIWQLGACSPLQAVNPSCWPPPKQIMRLVTSGRRPEVPAREALPGPDTATWDGLDAYATLMQ